MEDRCKNLNQSEIDNLLASLGIIMPRNEEELDMVLNEEDIETPELIDFRVDAKSIIERSKEKVNLKSKLCYAAEPKKKYSKQPNKSFKRIVLAAEITAQLHKEPTFGHVKLQKLVFLCENAVDMDFNFRYMKQAAGPYDHKFMHSIDPAFSKQKWFQIKKEPGKYGRIKYTPGEKFNEHKKYFDGYFNKDKEKIQQIIDMFRSQKSDIVELVATLFSCWHEMKNNKQLINNKSLVEAIYNWSIEKNKFSEIEIIRAIDWMNESNFHP